MQLKPILAQLSGPTEDGDEERRGMEAREGVEQYMSLLDVRRFLPFGQSEVRTDCFLRRSNLCFVKRSTTFVKHVHPRTL